MESGEARRSDEAQIQRAVDLVRVLQGAVCVAMAILAVYLTDGYALAVFVPVLAYLTFVFGAAGIRYLHQRNGRKGE